MSLTYRRDGGKGRTMFDHHITIDSFGQMCPANWEEIASYLNNIIDGMEDDIVDEYGDLTFEGREKIDEIWQNYCNGTYDAVVKTELPE